MLYSDNKQDKTQIIDTMVFAVETVRFFSNSFHKSF